MKNNRARAHRSLQCSVALCLVLTLTLVTTGFSQAKSQAAQSGKRTASPLDPAVLDSVIEKAIAADEIPGAVLLVSHQGRIIHRKAYGNRALLPQREPMTLDTIFDLASLTKVVATTSAVMKLVEQGKVRLNDPVARYIPEFGANGKEQVTLRHVLTHHSGLRSIPRLPDNWAGADAVLKAIYEDTLVSPPGARFLYSDAGFIVLGELVHRVSGLPLEEFVAKNIFRPLGMRHTRFRPPEDWKSRIAPTEEIDLPEGAKAGSGKGRVLRGEVHDPRARGMGGVAGHAGLFSTADDLAIFCRMLLANGKGLLAAGSVAKITTPQSPPWSPTQRGLGWDIDSVYSAPRGEFFPVGSFGHTGFTGTSLWINPSSQTFVILLANSVHPYGRPAISSLRSRVATAVAAALNVDGQKRPGSRIERGIGADRALPRNAQTRAGIDVLAEQNFAPLRGKRVGLITNHTGMDRSGRSTIDLLAKAEGVQVVALFSPEHGIAGREDARVPSGTDAATGLPIHSLYGDTRRPTEEMLRGIDALVFDIQDAGVRFYTYTTTMGYAMEEAAKRKIAFYVLDRPNPLGGEAIEGPILDRDRLSFVGYFPMPVRYAMTLGELAQMFNAENKIGADLHVIAMKDWQRRDTFEATGLRWTAPSPNLRSLDAALLYPGIEILQAGDVSVGRGTDTPFELFGAPWMRATELADYLNRRFVPGVRFVPTRFTPRAGLHKDVPCEGIALVITDRASLHAMLMGLEIAAALWKLYPEKFEIDKIITLVGSAATLERLKKGDAPTRIVEDWAEELDAFRKLRAKYLLYR
jgi:uncharacterized protein YbbC (DUF1343 family)/CubicO group peptidase (beta-lactamase class C family)